MKIQKLLTLPAAAVLCVVLILFTSCRSINRPRSELGIPQSLVFLSFDDGPNRHADTTARLLDVLKKHEVKAMFALLGENVEHNPELTGRILEEGHCIINHGYSDKWAGKMRPAEFRDNLLKGEKAIAEALGYELSPKLYRPQGGFYRKGMMPQSHSGQDAICLEEGYTMVLSNVRVYDAILTGRDPVKVVKEVINKVKKCDGGIILLHDARDSHFRMERELIRDASGPFNRSWIPSAVEKIIIELREKGYTIGSPDEFLSLKGF